MKAIERIYKYIEYQCIKVSDFEKKNSLSNGYLGKMRVRNADIGESIMLQILENCPDLSPLWLLLGEGEMLRTQRDEQPECSGSATEIELLRSAIRDKDVRIEELKERIDDLKENQQLLREKITFLEVKLARCEGMAAGAAAG